MFGNLLEQLQGLGDNFSKKSVMQKAVVPAVDNLCSAENIEKMLYGLSEKNANSILIIPAGYDLICAFVEHCEIKDESGQKQDAVFVRQYSTIKELIQKLSEVEKRDEDGE